MNLFDIEQFVHMRIVRAYRKRLQPDPITLEDIKKRRGNGEALYSIAKDYGVGKEKLQKFCEEHNFKPPPVPWKDWEGLTLAVFELVKNGEENALENALENPSKVYHLDLTLNHLNRSELRRLAEFENLESLNLSFGGLKQFPKSILECDISSKFFD